MGGILMGSKKNSKTEITEIENTNRDIGEFKLKVAELKDSVKELKEIKKKNEKIAKLEKERSRLLKKIKENKK